MNTSLLPFVSNGHQLRVDLRKPSSTAPTCPHCQCKDVRRFLEMHQGPLQATEDGADQSQRGYALDSFKGTAQYRTCQERRMVPPSEPCGIRIFLGIMIGVGALVLVLSIFGVTGAGYGIFAAAMALVSGFCLVESTMGKRDMAIRIRRWENSWTCLRCGRTFMS